MTRTLSRHELDICWTKSGLRAKSGQTLEDLHWQPAPRKRHASFISSRDTYRVWKSLLQSIHISPPQSRFNFYNLVNKKIEKILGPLIKVFHSTIASMQVGAFVRECSNLPAWLLLIWSFWSVNCDLLISTTVKAPQECHPYHDGITISNRQIVILHWFYYHPVTSVCSQHLGIFFNKSLFPSRPPEVRPPPIDLPHNKYCPSKAVPFFSFLSVRHVIV